MSRIGDAILTVEELFRKDFDELKRLSEEELERFDTREFSSFDEYNESVEEEIYYGIVEGRVYAYANVAKKLIGDESLMKEYEQFVDWYRKEAFKIIEEKEGKHCDDYSENYEA